jgi:maleylacetate reductase
LQAFTYEALPGRVVFGAGSFDRAVAEIDRLDARRVLLIADRSSAEWASKLAERLAGRLVARIDNVRVHVPIEDAEAARALALETLADSVITIGGGSATGLGKAVALELPVRFLAIPTTYAGSEMTPIWGMTAGERKTTGRDPRVQPSTVVYDPVLTVSLPPQIAGPSGMNAMAHCAEALYGDDANPITTVMAEEGLRVLARGLPLVVSSPHDLEARAEVLAGAYLAGTAFAAAGGGLHHKICHTLGGAYDLPHAEMHAVVLPHALAFKAAAVPDPMLRMARAIGEDDVPGAIFDLAVTIGAPTSLAQIGMSEARLDEAAGLIVDAVPHSEPPVTHDAMRELLERAYRGVRPSYLPSRREPLHV